MALSLQPRQTQKQVITPAMMLQFSLLQLPIGDLREEVRRELDSNPALEVENLRGLSGRIRSASGAGDLVDTVAAESGETLEDHLMSELRMAGVAGREAELCQAIIADIDQQGRFTGSVPDLQMQTGASARELEAARQRVMSIDPKGCGARDLAECYRAQLDDVPEARREEVARAIDAIAAMSAGGPRSAVPAFAPAVLALLKKLNAFPGQLYDRRKVEFVTPDVTVDEDGDVEVDQNDIPDLRVSPKYVQMAQDKTLDEETRRYAADRVKRAREFRQALLDRQEKMQAIAELAIGGQPGFLERGAAGLRRQTMSDVAKKAKCSIANVSRAAARKYVKTPRGTVPFRKFFVLVDQEPVEKLREILNALPPGEKVSDRVLSERMAKAGCPMARRTVAKYRLKLQGPAAGKST